MEQDTKAPTASGLDGIVVAETKLSEVDGERGRLIIGGSDVERLAGSASFEDVCAALWQVRGGADSVRAALGEGRVKAFERLPALGDALGAESGMDAIRAAVAHLRGDLEPAAIAAAVAVFAAAWSRVSSGESPLAPDASLGHAEDVLRMVRGVAVAKELAAGLDAYLVTVSDHGMNASTFAARVVTSTGSDAVSAVVAAIGALKGPLHGGAPGPVLDMIDSIGAPDHAEAWIEAELAAGRRIMGMGHRIYRVRDPRAAVLERAIERLERAGVSSRRLALARAIERAAEGALRKRHPDRPLHANVEFYTAVLLDTIGLPRRLFSQMFAVGRAAGWCAHIEEQRAHGRLIRPASSYIGARPAEPDSRSGDHTAQNAYQAT
jgi:citrate synthase